MLPRIATIIDGGDHFKLLEATSRSTYVKIGSPIYRHHSHNTDTDNECVTERREVSISALDPKSRLQVRLTIT